MQRVVPIAGKGVPFQMEPPHLLIADLLNRRPSA
jgi:hypothetical protein